jgi:hypothetical protein
VGRKKLHLYLKKKKLFFFAGSRRKNGGNGGWGGNRLNYGKMKKCKLKR